MIDLNSLIRSYRNTTDLYTKNIFLSEVISSLEQTIKYFLMKYANIDIDQEDLRAELRIEIYRSIDDFDKELGVSFKTFISRCFENRCNNILRDSLRDKRVAKNEVGEVLKAVSYEYLLGEGIDVAEGVCGDYGDVEIMMLLDSLDLPDRDKAICEGFIRGLRPIEIAEKLGVAPATITYRTKKIRSVLANSYNF